MEIRPVGEESLGVRSMCLYVETRDVRILLDAGVSLAPRRFGLPPHPRELERARAVRAEIMRLAEGADVVTISHYHRDHFTQWYPSTYMATDGETYRRVYGGRKVLAKSPHDLNWSQRRRHYGLAKALQEAGAEVAYADGGEWRFEGTVVKASQSLWHGPAGSKTGRVVAFAVLDGEERLAFVPDVEGPVEPEPVDFLREVRPTIVVLGGPPTYLNWELDKPLAYLREVVDLGPRVLVLAHHLLRDAEWRGKVAPVLEYAERRGVAVTTYAGLLGRGEELLEARRRELYQAEPAEAAARDEDEED
ncbi:MBL fold metallo-hydrolase [Pyrobaculum sp. 3827-6]|uniref:MBL fold metallo-hydrolase n=1 Tax=Pyrobaculum sp. 3827-6 TaxID=2983604 RepID=UPI0021DACEAD|nr:MBL fold metallo-hydrolase [Pyrobaculum sp. 3827-6]MCU7786786.1 MBL fold metallo-hydrolase [Pyrobaculum sp. 3827-6]